MALWWRLVEPSRCVAQGDRLDGVSGRHDLAKMGRDWPWGKAGAHVPIQTHPQVSTHASSRKSARVARINCRCRRAGCDDQLAPHFHRASRPIIILAWSRRYLSQGATRTRSECHETVTLVYWGDLLEIRRAAQTRSKVSPHAAMDYHLLFFGIAFAHICPISRVVVIAPRRSSSNQSFAHGCIESRR